MRWYKLNEDKTTELLENHESITEKDFRDEVKTVCIDRVNGQRVSTVFMHLDHSLTDDGTPQIFETMIFEGQYDGCYWRYSNWEDAKKGHDRVVFCLKNFINPNE